jgi:hypothetical protein
MADLTTFSADCHEICEQQDLFRNVQGLLFLYHIHYSPSKTWSSSVGKITKQNAVSFNLKPDIKGDQ